MRKPALVFLTGITGSGKSTTGNHLAGRCENEGLKAVFINDYPMLIKWAEKNEGDLTKVEWYETTEGKNFSINPAAYQELSISLATEIAKQIETEHLSQIGADVIIIESARGAGLPKMRDRYDQHLFEPVKKVLGNSVHYINIEMKVPDIEMLLERVRSRLTEDPTAAPEVVAHKYIDETGNVQSATLQAKELGHFSLNVEVNNGGNKDETLRLLEGITAQVLSLLLAAEDGENKEGESTEDQLRFGFGPEFL